MYQQSLLYHLQLLKNWPKYKSLDTEKRSRLDISIYIQGFILRCDWVLSIITAALIVVEKNWPEPKGLT